MHSPEVLIVGAGLTGLSCAERLGRADSRCFPKAKRLWRPVEWTSSPSSFADRLPPGTVRTECPVVAVDKNAVVLEPGERIQAQHVVLACDAHAAASCGRGEPR